MENHIQELEDLLLKIGAYVQDYRPDQSAKLQKSIQDMLDAMKQLDHTSESLQGTIPSAVLEMIQRDIHPDTYLQSMIQTLIDKNQKLCGKMHQLQKLKEELIRQSKH